MKMKSEDKPNVMKVLLATCVSLEEKKLVYSNFIMPVSDIEIVEDEEGYTTITIDIDAKEMVERMPNRCRFLLTFTNDPFIIHAADASQFGHTMIRFVINQAEKIINGNKVVYKGKDYKYKAFIPERRFMYEADIPEFHF